MRRPRFAASSSRSRRACRASSSASTCRSSRGRCTAARVIRSAHHSVNNAHAAAVYCALTGHDRGEIGGGARPDDYPAIGSVVGMQRPPQGAIVPHVLLAVTSRRKAPAGRRSRASSAAGSASRATRSSSCATRTRADFALPELTLGPDIDPNRFDARKLLAEQHRIAGNRRDSSATLTASARGPTTCSRRRRCATPFGSTASRRSSATPTAGTSTARACSCRGG